MATALPSIDDEPNRLGELLRERTFLSPDGSRHGDFRAQPDAQELDWEDLQRLIAKFRLTDEPEAFGLIQVAEGCTYQLGELTVEACCYARTADSGTIIFHLFQSGRLSRFIISTDCKRSDGWVDAPEPGA